MINYILFSRDGKLKQQGAVMSEKHLPILSDGEIIKIVPYISPLNMNTTLQFINGDIETKFVEDAKHFDPITILKLRLNEELNKRLSLPCNGFDADATARERISGMVARLQRGDGLPAGWVGWRDASNQQQWATDDAATVLANLTALSRSIEDREQALLVASWQHKANIEALTDIDTILAYDITKSWP